MYLVIGMNYFIEMWLGIVSNCEEKLEVVLISLKRCFCRYSSSFMRIELNIPQYSSNI